MPVTYVPIASQTLGASAASVTFSSIPQTYTDLVLRLSMRNDEVGGVPYNDMALLINGVNSGGLYSRTSVVKDTSTATSTRQTSANFFVLTNGSPNNSATANTFNSAEFYFPNYTGTAPKPMSGVYAHENNSTTQYMAGVAGLFSSSSAITSITLSNGPFVAGSSFHLYGIANQ